MATPLVDSLPLEWALKRLAQMTPIRLLVALWAALLVVSLLMMVPPLSGLAMALGFLVLCGYPYLVILGLPKEFVRTSVRSWASRFLLGFIVLLLFMIVLVPLAPEGYSTPTSPRSASEWLELFFGLATNIVIFGPFFLGSAALNDSRRAMKQDPTLESLVNFLALYFGIGGGVIYVHRRIREVFKVA